jgi:hypothetical protein
VSYGTALFHPASGSVFDYPESYIIQRFYPSTNYNFEGTIIAHTVQTSNNHAIQISLVNDLHQFQKGFTIFDGNLAGEYVPTCAAYNSITSEYCIA